MRIALIGRGRVGHGLARALRARGVDATLTSGHQPSRSALRGRDAIFITTGDVVIGDVAARIGPWVGATPVLHCSGSHGPDLVASCTSPGVMHPLVSFASPRITPELAGTAFVIDGVQAARRVATRVARTLGARPVYAAVHGPTYHAAAALSANGAAALSAISVRVLTSLGISKPEATQAIGALLRSVAENIERVGLPSALSGPAIRGDVAAIRRHRESLQAHDPHTRKVYDAVVPAIVQCARDAGLDARRARAILKELAQRPESAA